MKNIIIMLFSLTLIACGGGGGGDAPAASTDTTTSTNTSTTFSLFPSGFLSNGYRESYSLSGSDTAGGTHQGNYSLQTQSQTTFNGQAAIPISVILNWTNTQTNAFITIPVTAYYSTSADSLRSLGFDDALNGIITVTANTTIIPQTGKIGDFGNIGTYTDSAGNSQTVTWRITDAGNGKANIVTASSIKDQSGTLTATTETTITIDSNGNRTYMSMKIYFVSEGLTFTLSGNKA